MRKGWVFLCTLLFGVRDPYNYAIVINYYYFVKTNQCNYFNATGTITSLKGYFRITNATRVVLKVKDIHNYRVFA